FPQRHPARRRRGLAEAWSARRRARRSLEPLHHRQPAHRPLEKGSRPCRRRRDHRDHRRRARRSTANDPRFTTEFEPETVTRDDPEKSDDAVGDEAHPDARRSCGAPPWVLLVLVTVLSSIPACDGGRSRPSRVQPPPADVSLPRGDRQDSSASPEDRDAASRNLTSDEALGKEIYRKGISRAGDEVSAVLGESTTAVPASVLACVNCHGHDGVGKPEGGIVPPEITWEALTKSYGE